MLQHGIIKSCCNFMDRASLALVELQYPVHQAFHASHPGSTLALVLVEELSVKFLMSALAATHIDINPSRRMQGQQSFHYNSSNFSAHPHRMHRQGGSASRHCTGIADSFENVQSARCYLLRIAPSLQLVCCTRRAGRPNLDTDK
jgi:hypothetical protein